MTRFRSATTRKRLSVALVGLNHPHSLLLLRTLENLGEVGDVVVWAESRGEFVNVRAGEFPKVRRRTTSLRAVARAARIDCAIVCVPTCDVPHVAGTLLRARKPVLVDKPASVTAAGLARLVDLARTKGACAGVLYGQRAHPAVRCMRDVIARGGIGRVVAVESRLVTTQVKFRDPRHWLFSRAVAGGGVLAWLGCHYLDLIPHLVGEPVVEVAATHGRLSTEPTEVEDVAAVTLRLRSGAIATLHCGYLLAHSGAGYGNRAGFDSRLAIHGTQGRLVWGGVTRPSLFLELPGPGGQAIRRRLRSRQRATNSYGGATGEDFVRQFLQAVHDGGEGPCPLDQALATSATIEACYSSARRERTIRVSAPSNPRRSGSPRR